MKSQGRFGLIVGVLVGLLLGATLIWSLQTAWDFAGAQDQDPASGSLKGQMMRRKSAAMAQMLDAVVDGDLREVGATAERIQTYKTTIDGFLRTVIYRKHGEAFHQSLAEIGRAVRDADRNAVKEAVLRLERSCIDCHQLLNAEGHEPASPENQ